MSYRNPDFDLRPRRLASPMPMLSTMQVDDDDDLLDALAAAAVARWDRNVAVHRDARHFALAALPSTLCTPAGDWTWTPARRKRQRAWQRPDRAMIGGVVSAALAVLMLVAAMMWRIEHPRVVYVEGTAPAIRAAQPDVDAVSSASP